MDDFISFDTAELQKQIAAIDRKLSTIDRDLRNGIMDTVLHEAAEQLQAEQKRILSTAPTEGIRGLASELSIWKDTRKSAPSKVSYRAGYSDSKVEQSKKYFIIEFGRPGKRHAAGIDKKGRRIGRVAPFSHIRAAWFLKKDSINKYIAERVDAEILERWNK